ncbi:alpha/beta hydrolase [Pandoraea apista]|uniref:Carboxylesterase n=2 Tax=Pandoraea apista TaxID=93218 RepID=A0A5E5P4Y1_9BURK|nr:alpha/beta hydrolase [Pandoraea apista]VVG71708.1 carboxylesterase [Pandoraea apista]
MSAVHPKGHGATFRVRYCGNAMKKHRLSRLLSTLSACATLCACTPVNVVNALTPSKTYRLVPDIAYGDAERLKLDVYVPTRPAGRAASMPVVVFFYGGSWQSGERAEYRFVGEALASRGFLAILPDYRTYPDVIFPTFMDDAAKAVRWAIDRASAFGGDSERVFLMGHSAGAQIAALLVTDERYLLEAGLATRNISGMVGLAGPYDFLPLQSKVLRRIFPEPVRKASQPIEFVTGCEPPIFLGVGDTDSVVSPGNAVRFAERLRAMHSTVEIRHYNLGHALMLGAISAPLRRFSPVLDDIADFVNAISERRVVRQVCTQTEHFAVGDTSSIK